MHNRFVQENNLACEKKYGGMTRYSPGSDQSGQARYEKELKDNIRTATDIATIPVTPIPSHVRKKASTEENNAAGGRRSAVQTQTVSDAIRHSAAVRGCGHIRPEV